MSILFLNAILLPLLILGILPLLLHLFSRAKPPVYKFSSNEFLKLIIKRTKRIRKPQDLILLLIRTLLFLAIIFMFLQPLFFSNKKLAGLLANKNIVILVDASSSMSYLEGGQTRFASACAEASGILRGLSSRDKANIIFIKSKPDSLFPTPGSNVNYLREKLRHAQVSNERGNVESAIRKALDMFDGLGEGIDEICIISDFQQSQWKNHMNLQVPGDIAVTLVKVGKTNGSNQAVSKVSSTPLLPLLGEEVTFHCEISNYSSEPKRVSVYFRTGELHESKTLLVPAWGSATPSFKAKHNEKLSNKDSLKENLKEGVLSGFQKAGTFAYDFSIGEDDFAEDNKRWGLLKVEKSLKTGIVDFTPYPGVTWEKALSIFPWMDVRKEKISTLSPDDDYDFLFLSGWDGSDLDKIKKFIKKGTIVICAPVSGTDISKLALLAGQNKTDERGSILEEKAPEKTPFRLKISDQKEKMFKLFAKGEFGDPVSGFVKTRLQVPKNFIDKGAAIISYTDNTPALIRCPKQDRGQLYIWNIPLNPEKSNFATRVQFVPLMAEFVLSSRRGGDDIGHLANFTPGEQLVKVVDFVGSIKEIKLKDAAGKDLPIKIEVDKDRKTGTNATSLSLVSVPVSKTGVYSWDFSGKKVGNSVVNFAVSESDLRSIPTSELKIYGTSAIAGVDAVSDIHEGVMLWPYLLALSVILVISEGLVMLWAEKVK